MTDPSATGRGRGPRPAPGRRGLAPRPLTEPHPDRLPPRSRHRDEVLAAHALALEQGEVGYRDPVTGLFVFGARYLADRGSCCERGCRHCPYVQ